MGADEDPPSAPATRRRRRLPAGLWVLLAAPLPFLPALRGEFLHWDDVPNVVANPHVQGLGRENLAWMFTTFHLGPYQPLSWLSLALDHAVWGLNPFGYHLTNLVLHALGAWLAYRVLRYLLRHAARVGTEAASPPGLEACAAIGACFFALHPLRVESVAWITERRDVLGGVGFLAAVLAWLASTGSCGRRRAALLALSAVAFAFSLLSKASGMALPLVLLALDAFPLRRLRGEAGALRRALLEKTPHFLLALAAAAVALVGQRSAGAVQTLDQQPWVERLAQSAYGLVFYPGRTLWPTRLSPFYERAHDLDPLEPRFFLAALVVVLGAVLVVATARRLPALACAAFCYAVLVAPVLGLVPVGGILAADRYSYLPCLPFAALAAGGLFVVRTRSPRPELPMLAAFAVLALLVVGTWRQARLWRSSVALWTRAVELDPDGFMASFQLARALVGAGTPAAALPHYERALESLPGHPEALLNLAAVLSQLGREPEALRRIAEVLESAPEHPEALHALALALYRQGRYADAVRAHRRSLARRPDRAAGHANLGQALWELGRRAEAREAWRRALQLEPGLAVAQAGLARPESE